MEARLGAVHDPRVLGKGGVRRLERVNVQTEPHVDVVAGEHVLRRAEGQLLELGRGWATAAWALLPRSAARVATAKVFMVQGLSQSVLFWYVHIVERKGIISLVKCDASYSLLRKPLKWLPTRLRKSVK